MPRTRAHAAARIDGAECTRALQVRRRWRRRIAPRDATDAECGASACGLTPRRRQRRRRRRRRRKLLVLDTVVTRRCRVRFCVPRRGGAPSGASVHRSDAPGVWPGCVSRVRATRGAWSVVRGGGARATRGARSEVRFLPPMLARLRVRRRLSCTAAAAAAAGPAAFWKPLVLDTVVLRRC